MQADIHIAKRHINIQQNQRRQRRRRQWKNSMKKLKFLAGIETWHSSCKSRAHHLSMRSAAVCECFNWQAIEHLVSHASRMLFGIICNPNVVTFYQTIHFNCEWLLNFVVEPLHLHSSHIACLPLRRTFAFRLAHRCPFVCPPNSSVCLSAWARSVSAHKQSIDLWSVKYFFLNETGRCIVQIKIKNFEMIHIEATHHNTTQSVWSGSFYYIDFTLCFVDTK